jgi:RNA polymerase sigma-70 factor (ECF subfamily)
MTGRMGPARKPVEPVRISASYSDRPNDPGIREAERALVARAQEGDRAAFEVLYRDHVQAVARQVRLRLGSADEDVVAEVFLRAWRGLASYRDMGRAFGAWLHGIAHHVIVDELRTRARITPVAEIPDRGMEPMTVELLSLREALDRLPDDQRKVIELKYLVGMTNDEVAVAMESTPGAINTKQWRALRTLSNILGETP